MDKFDTWMAKVDAIILAKTGGLTSADLIDNTYMDMFEGGYTPEEAAMDSLENEGWEE